MVVVAIRFNVDAQILKQDNGSDHRAGTEIIASIYTRKPGFACIILLFGVLEFAQS